MKTIYIDMDGVLARWCETSTREDTHRHGYFLTREPEPAVIEAARVLSHASILSAVYEDDHSCTEKRIWLRAHGLGDIPFIAVPYGSRKGDFIKDEASAILLDDFSKNLEEWRGTPVKFYNGINGKKKAHTYHYSLSNDMSAQQLMCALSTLQLL